LALRREQTSIQAVVEEAATAVRALFESKGLDLQLEILPDIPPVLCDTTRIRQVLINLLSNAGRYTESGGVRVATELIGSDVVVRVADTGPGIAQSDIERLFEPFQQIESPLRGQPGGSGLGLSISKRFVEMHGGTLWVESTPGVGSTFSFSLPVTPPASAALVSSQYSRWINPYQHHEPRTHPSRVPPPTTQPRFVFLDHGDAACHYLSHYLDGAEIEHVRAPAEARAALTQSPAGALIVNESAFGQDPEVVELLRQLPYDTPALSCWIPGSDDAARQLGVLRYLVKPIERDALLSTLAVLGEGPHIVLIVDDQPEVLQLFTRMLASSDRQYRILQAKNGQRALDLLRNRRPDIVLLDLIMPVMDGFEVLRQKNADPGIRDIPVIVVSSRDPSGDPVASQSLTVTRSGGLSIRSLANCIQALTSLLAPSPRRADQS